ncbi:hypothetical protein PROPHIGD17-1_34 [Mycobacterium phage prophiGD17-1]|nr:hypothetical protein PHIGD17-1_73 [Mycobacterium phage phiGD17-1]QSM02735.1 hypothetical protein PROPHIGD17-1_34 [Mycobacterium phage prophiGD17-1]
MSTRIVFPAPEPPKGSVQCGRCGRFCRRNPTRAVTYWPDTWVDHYLCQSCKELEL